MSGFITTRIVLRGPLFEGNAERKSQDNITEFMKELASDGEAYARNRMTGSPEADATAPLIVGRTYSASGRQWHQTAVVSVYTAGMSRVAQERALAIAAGRHADVGYGTTRGGEGRTHAFRATRAHLSAAIRAHQRTLTKGL